MGADVNEATALELWQDLERGVLDNAGNVQDDAQLGTLCQWLIEL